MHSAFQRRQRFYEFHASPVVLLCCLSAEWIVAAIKCQWGQSECLILVKMDSNIMLRPLEMGSLGVHFPFSS